MKTVDVVIPTRNRPASLLRCLEALAAQTYPEFGTIIIDDASDRPVEQVIPEDLREKLRARVLRQPNASGAGGARNRGVAESEADIIVFVDDDVRAIPQLIAYHVQALTEGGSGLATFGPLLPPSDWKPTPWTLWEAAKLTDEYGKMNAGAYEPSWRHFITGNAAVWREEFLSAGAFDAAFSRAEDVELALRMAEQGCRFAFLPHAIGWHYPERSVASWLDIPAQYGRCHWLMDQKHPEEGWLATVRTELRNRHPLLRVARALGRRWPRAGARAAIAASQALLRAGAERLSLYAVSAAFDLQYTEALRQQTAGAAPALPAGPTVRVCVSMTRAETQAERNLGPRRDFIELARAVEQTGAKAVIHYRKTDVWRRGLAGRVLSLELSHAWEVAGQVRRGDVVYADQEALGVALLGTLALRRRRPLRVVVLAHLPGRRWKATALWLATRLLGPGRLVVHSQRQADLIRPYLPGNWLLLTLPYQVDAEFWRTTGREQDPLPLLVAVGSEQRDYVTLVRAVEGLPVKLVIAAGSNWARSIASAGRLPANVEYISRVVPYRHLRDLYERATLVAVPLVEGSNQAGITCLLEGMSMSRPVVTTATAGQQEAVCGPLVRSDGGLDPAATAGRGPSVIIPEARGLPCRPNGLYVPPGDVGAWRAAIMKLVEDRDLRESLGAAGRQDAERFYSIEAFSTRFGLALTAPDGREPRPAPVASTA
jgi:GT2 family glycosyltransferase